MLLNFLLATGPSLPNLLRPWRVAIAVIMRSGPRPVQSYPGFVHILLPGPFPLGSTPLWNDLPAGVSPMLRSSPTKRAPSSWALSCRQLGGSRLFVKRCSRRRETGCSSWEFTRIQDSSAGLSMRGVGTFFCPVPSPNPSRLRIPRNPLAPFRLPDWLGHIRALSEDCAILAGAGADSVPVHSGALVHRCRPAPGPRSPRRRGW